VRGGTSSFNQNFLPWYVCSIVFPHHFPWHFKKLFKVICAKFERSIIILFVDLSKNL